MFWLDTVILVTLGAGTVVRRAERLLRQVARLVGFALALYASIYLNATASTWLAVKPDGRGRPPRGPRRRLRGRLPRRLLLVMLVTAVLGPGAGRRQTQSRWTASSAPGSGCSRPADPGALLMGIVLYAQPGPTG